MGHQSCRFVCGVVLAVCGVANAHNVIEVGRDEHGHLHAHTEAVYELEPSTITGVTGFAMEDPPFLSLQLPDLMEGLFPIDAAASLRVRVVGLENLEILQVDTLEDFPVGGDIFLGKLVFNVPVIWRIAGGGVGASGSATIVLQDLGGVHEDSEAITLRFVAVPTPGALGVLGLGAMVAVRRQRAG